MHGENDGRSCVNASRVWFTAHGMAVAEALALAALTRDAELARRLLAAPFLQRLSFGSVPTCRVSWDQPHEGNLFEHLYVRRALQGLPGAD
jgi:hypothetical protein